MAPAEGRDRGQVRGTGPVGHVDRVLEKAHRPRNPDSRRRALRPSRPRGQPRLVQGELAAREDDGRSACRTSGPCRTTSPSTRPPAPPAASTPSRGTSSSPSPPAGSSAPGSTCARARAFGTVFTAELDPSQAIFVPRGVGNAYQTLEDDTAYTYLVNDHWSADAQGQYTFLNLADETAAIRWPIPLEEAELSDKDKAHPRLADVTPMPPKKVWSSAPTASSAGPCAGVRRRRLVEFAGRAEFDLGSEDAFAGRNWRNYSADHQRRRLHRGRRGRDTGRPRGRLGGQRHRRRAAGPDRRRARPHAGALLLRLRLRRHRGRPRRGRAVLPAGRLRPDQGRRRRRGQRGAPALHRAHQLGDWRRQQLRPHHGRPSRPAASTRRWSTTRSGA